MKKQIDETISVGEHIRNLRINAGVPLRKLAAELDIDTSTLSKMERGERPFSLDMAPTIAKALEIDFKSLQVALLASMVLKEHGDEEYVEEGLKLAVKNLDKNRRKEITKQAAKKERKYVD